VKKWGWAVGNRQLVFIAGCQSVSPDDCPLPVADGRQ